MLEQDSHQVREEREPRDREKEGERVPFGPTRAMDIRYAQMDRGLQREDEHMEGA